MNVLKFILFVELIAMFVCVVMHLYAAVTKQKVELDIYPIIAGMVLVACLFVVYIFSPFADWFFNL